MLEWDSGGWPADAPDPGALCQPDRGLIIGDAIAVSIDEHTVILTAAAVHCSNVTPRFTRWQPFCGWWCCWQQGHGPVGLPPVHWVCYSGATRVSALGVPYLRISSSRGAALAGRCDLAQLPKTFPAAPTIWQKRGG